MNVLVIMIPMALLLGFGFVAAFIFATRTGQFDDTDTPAHRMLEDEPAAIPFSSIKDSHKTINISDINKERKES